MKINPQIIKSLTSFDSLNIFIDLHAEDHEILNQIHLLKIFPEIRFKKHMNYTLTCRNGKLGFLFGNQHLICVDYFSKENLRRRRNLGKTSPFFKALGLSPYKTSSQDFHFYDLTAGFAQDAFLILNHCKKLVLVERNPIIYIMLYDAILRLLKVCPQFENRIELLFDEAQNYLNALHQFPEKSLIFFDFMFESKKSKSNKNMYFLKKMTQKDSANNKIELLNHARKKSPTRVVLKTKSPELESQGVVFKGSVVQYILFPPWPSGKKDTALLDLDN